MHLYPDDLFDQGITRSCYCWFRHGLNSRTKNIMTVYLIASFFCNAVAKEYVLQGRASRCEVRQDSTPLDGYQVTAL